MPVTSVRIDHPPDAVFAVLADPWRFADWVVGAKCIRAVDPSWPAPGSRFHHRFGLGPLTIDDSTVLEAIDAPRMLVLRARARPTGEARVRLRLTPAGDGATDVEMEEHPVSPLARRLDNPVLETLTATRNRRSLHRLAGLVAERAAGSG